jgi:hypothetical protein
MQTQCKVLAVGISQVVNRVLGVQEQPLLPLACPRPVFIPLKEVVVVTPPVRRQPPEQLKKPHFV